MQMHSNIGDIGVQSAAMSSHSQILSGSWKTDVICTAILTSDEIILSRQFVDVTRQQVENLIRGFRALPNWSADRTTIETKSVRYNSQALGNLHLLLVSGTQRNALEDLRILKILGDVVRVYCEAEVSKERVLSFAFDIVFAFDEVVSCGYLQCETLSDIKMVVEMDSQEEKLCQVIDQSKINEARAVAKQKHMKPKGGRLAQPKVGLGGAAMDQTVAALRGQPLEIIGQTGVADTTQPLPKPNAPKKGMSLGKKKSEHASTCGMAIERAPVMTSSVDSRLDVALRQEGDSVNESNYVCGGIPQNGNTQGQRPAQAGSGSGPPVECEAIRTAHQLTAEQGPVVTDGRDLTRMPLELEQCLQKLGCAGVVRPSIISASGPWTKYTRGACQSGGRVGECQQVDRRMRLSTCWTH